MVIRYPFIHFDNSWYGPFQELLRYSSHPIWCSKLWFSFALSRISGGVNLQGTLLIVEHDISNAAAVQQLHGGLALWSLAHVIGKIHLFVCSSHSISTCLLSMTLEFCVFEQVEYLPVVFPSAWEVQNPAKFADRVGSLVAQALFSRL